METNEIQIPKIGEVVTVTMYTDRYTADVISVSKSGKTALCRRRIAKIVKKPVMIPGGFAGVITENAVWKTSSNSNGETFKITLRKNNRWKISGSRTNEQGGNVWLNSDSHYYDYWF